MKVTVYFENEKQGYATMTANSMEYDEVDGEQIFSYIRTSNCGECLGWML